MATDSERLFPGKYSISSALEAAANLGIALLGKLVGRGVLIGLYYAYVNDDTKFRT